MARDGWQTVRLGDVCLINPEKRGPDWPYEVMEYIDISSVGTGVLNQKPEVIAIQDAPSRAQRLVRNNDVIVSTVRPNRRSFLFLKNPKPNTVVSTGFVVLRATDKIDPRFLYYVVSTQDFTDYLEAHTEGSAYPAVSTEVFEEARIELPPLPEQRAIAHILGTLDDKIELNRRMNETLEAIARAIFKSWFVDFDPVRAKMEDRWRPGGSLPGLPAHLYNLFPNRLVDSELGEIPEGWRVETLGEHMINFDSQRIPVSGAERTKRQGQYPYYGAAGILDYIDNYLFDGIYLLVGEDGSVVQENGMAVIQYVWGKIWVNNHAHVLQGKEAVSTEQLYLYFQFEPVTPYVTGAVQPKLSQGRMKSMPFIFAGEFICRVFAEMVSPWFAKLRINTDQNRTLSVLRDTLLPRLITGQLQVRNVEKLMEDIL